ncbi:MAG: SGNH/GDSL hydrolase family protein [Microgenomates group bacterium]
MIPLFYQLIEAYHPQSYSPPSITLISDVSTPSVLGVATSSIVTPQNIGGEGQVYTIGFLGDSMVQTLGEDLQSIKTSLSQLFPRHVFHLINRGTGSQNIEYGLNTELPLLLDQKPDIIVVESFAYNNFGNTQTGYDRHWLALGAITSTIRQKLPQTKIIIATTIAPNSIVFANGVKDLQLSSLDKVEKTSTIKLYLQNAINFATSQGFALADAYHPSLINNEGSRQYINSVDNIHPSAAGASLFANVLTQTISGRRLID